ncbi:MAG: hypothetical protein HY217_00135 [Candidatus Rokubacteria bacterium]|nr:hypothetical protein [Candidatus Rokubacteria bacterium]
MALAAIVGAGFGIAAMYVYPSFRPTSAEAARQAMDIMFRFRIPHHTMVTRWFPLPTAVKFVVILAGLAVTWRRPRVCAILAIPLAIGLGLTIVQIVTGSEFLGLVYPWRVGVVLVPLSATLLIAWSLDRLWPSLSRGAARLVVWSSGLLAIVAVVTGGLLTAAHFAAAAGNPALPMMKFVERTKSPGDVYLIPPNLEEFRFSAGAPTVVDFKAVAIKDTEVLEWYSRIRAVEPVYRTGVLDCPTLGGFKARYGVTHVVWPGSDPSGLCPELRPVYRDAGFAVYRVAER